MTVTTVLFAAAPAGATTLVAAQAADSMMQTQASAIPRATGRRALPAMRPNTFGRGDWFMKLSTASLASSATLLRRGNAEHDRQDAGGDDGGPAVTRQPRP